MSLFAHSSQTPCNLMDSSPPGSSVQGILQTRVLQWISMTSSRGSSRARDPTCISCVSCIAGRFFTCWAICSFQFSSVQLLSRVWRFETSWITARQASLSITNFQGSLKLMSIRSVIPSSHLILCRPLLLLPPMPPSIRVSSNESTLCMRWPKYWSFSFSISPSNEHPGLISFWMDWLEPLAVQGTCKSVLQHHSSKASILQHSAFFTVQISHPNMATGKTITLTTWTCVGKVISLILNMLSRLVITFLPRSKHLLISWLQSPSAVILESKKFLLNLNSNLIILCLTLHVSPCLFLLQAWPIAVHKPGLVS